MTADLLSNENGVPAPAAAEEKAISFVGALRIPVMPNLKKYW
jgi:hypothetical protein